MCDVNAENAKTQLRASMREIILNKIIDLRKELACQECRGSGEYSSPSHCSPCSYCDGTGFSTSEGCLNDILPPGVRYVKLADVLAILEGQNGIIKESQ